MAKRKQGKPHRRGAAPERPPQPRASWPGRLSARAQVVLSICALLLVVLIYRAPLVFGGKSPVGADVIGSEGKSHQIEQYRQRTGKRALWNPYVFSGMPVYHRYGGLTRSLDNLLGLAANTSGRNGALYLFIGGVGMLLLLRYLGLSRFPALIGALCFLLMPHWQGLLEAGHFAKFRPIMMMPWVLVSFLFLLDRRSLLAWLCFLLAFCLQLRTQHYQILFYTGLLLLAVGVRYGIAWLRQGAYLRILTTVAMILGAVGLLLLMVAQPLWVTREYTPYSIRGGTGEAGSTGLDFDYATGWSFSPREMLTLVMPRFFGGTSSERYSGAAVPPEIMARYFRDGRIPGYWGDMPFSGNTEYLGVVALILAALGLYAHRRNGLLLALAILAAFSLLLSFGRHFPALYSLFFQHMPVFSKFRVPSMILVLMMFIVSLLAAFGMASLLHTDRSRFPALGRAVLWIGGGLVLIGLIPLLFGGAFSFQRPGEPGRYGRLLPYLEAARRDMMRADALRLILLAGASCGLIWTYLRGWWSSRLIVSVCFFLLVLVDLISVGSGFLTPDRLADPKALEQTHFAQSGVDRFLLSDKGVHRILPVGELFNSNDWGYYHQPVSGYDPAKLRVTQDVIESCLYKGWDPRAPINWNVANMLNAKYVIAAGAISSPHLGLAYADESSHVMVYRNLTALPRAFFVADYEVIPQRKDRLARLNDRAFNPASTAILEFDPGLTLAKPDSAAAADVVLFEPDRVVLETRNPQAGLLVLSEIYYPKGWRALVDGSDVPIYKTNHLLRSVWVPEGEHAVEFRFEPATFFRSERISRYAMWAVYLLFLAELARRFGLPHRRRPIAEPNPQAPARTPHRAPEGQG